VNDLLAGINVSTVRQGKNNSFSINRDLSSLSRYTTIAYIIATLVLCCTILFSYITLKRILVEKSSLRSLQITTSELWTEVQDSSDYLADLKAARKQGKEQSQLVKKIAIRLNDSISGIEVLSEQTSEKLQLIKDYSYYERFNGMFSEQPLNISAKLEQYVKRLSEISAGSTSERDLLWLPVEATAAKSGVLGTSYVKALGELQDTIADRSNSLENTHLKLTLLSVAIVLLELLVIFFPLQRVLRRISHNLTKAHKKLNKQANYDEHTGLCNLSGMSKELPDNVYDSSYSGLLIVCRA